MTSIPPWSSSSEAAARVTSPRRLYEAHTESAPQCPWSLRSRQTREENEWRVYTAEAIRVSVENVQKQLQSMQQVSSSIKQQQEQKAEQARLLKEEQQKFEQVRSLEKQQEAEEARMAQEREEAEKVNAEAFPCRGCRKKFASNTKLYEHVRKRHARKQKPAVSSIPSTPPATPPQSVTSSPKTSPLSGSAPEYVPKRSESAPLTPPSTPQKPALVRPTTPSKTPSKTPYLTIDDLFSMFDGKPMRAKLVGSQNSPVSPGVSASQMRITSYFLPTSKSTNPEAST
ncbi:hypothetical protein G7Y79_00026g059190 [Physcia stellaris]|nr:hypothetical protein G7Y79_00026g059190 [Physcia stellaris]